MRKIEQLRADPSASATGYTNRSLFTSSAMNNALKDAKAIPAQLATNLREIGPASVSSLFNAMEDGVKGPVTKVLRGPQGAAAAQRIIQRLSDAVEVTPMRQLSDKQWNQMASAIVDQEMRSLGPEVYSRYQGTGNIGQLKYEGGRAALPNDITGAGTWRRSGNSAIIKSSGLSDVPNINPNLPLFEQMQQREADAAKTKTTGQAKPQTTQPVPAWKQSRAAMEDAVNKARTSSTPPAPKVAKPTTGAGMNIGNAAALAPWSKFDGVGKTAEELAEAQRLQSEKSRKVAGRLSTLGMTTMMATMGLEMAGVELPGFVHAIGPLTMAASMMPDKMIQLEASLVVLLLVHGEQQ